MRVKKIAYSNQARKTLLRIAVDDARRIQGKIEQYARDPVSLSNNVKRLRAVMDCGYALAIGGLSSMKTGETLMC